MTAIERILDKIDLNVLLDSYNLDYTEHGDQFRMGCPIHGGENKFSFVIEEKRGLYYCHSCGASGDVFDFIMYMDECEFPQAVEKLGKMFGIDIEGVNLYELASKLDKEFKTWKGILKKELEVFEEYAVDVEMKNVKAYASFNKETLIHFGVKFIPEIELLSRDGNKYTLRNYLSFPVMRDKMQLGLALRATNDTIPKWSLQPRSMHYGRIIYNYDELPNAEFVLLVEGIKDVMAFHEINIHAFATFGSHMTQQQYEIVLKQGKDLVLCYDGDKAGREATVKIAEMFRGKSRVYSMIMNDGEDAENISREELLTRWTEKKLYTK